jgi:hypothetical protein
MATYDQCKLELKQTCGWSDTGNGKYMIQFAASLVTGLAATCTTSPVTNYRMHIMASAPGKCRNTLHVARPLPRICSAVGALRPVRHRTVLGEEQLLSVAGMKAIGS